MSSPSIAPPPTSAKNEWYLLHMSFILIGVITTLLGPILPSFSRRWALTDAQAGFFFTTQYLGSTVGVALTSIFLPRFGFSKVTAAGFLSFFAGFLFLGVGPWQISSVMVAIIGLGYGLTNPAINLRSTQLPSKSTAAAVTFLNFSWSVGSVLCPFLVGALIPSIGLRSFSLMLAVLSLLFIPLHSTVRAAPAAGRPRATRPVADWLAHLRLPRAVPLLLLFFLYVGTEVALGGWVATFEKRMPAIASGNWLEREIFGLFGITLSLIIAPSVFYASLLFGRGVAPLVLRQHSQVLVSTLGLSLATAGAAIIALASSPHTLYFGAAFAGFGLAPQYPIFVTWLAAIFREDSNWIGALFFGAAGFGGGILPWLVGIVSFGTHSLRAGLCIPLAVSFLMIFLAFRARPQIQPS